MTEGGHPEVTVGVGGMTSGEKPLRERDDSERGRVTTHQEKKVTVGV